MEVVGHRIDQFSWRLYLVRHKWQHSHKRSSLRIRYRNPSIFSAWQPKLDPMPRVARYNLDSRDLIYRQSNDSCLFFQICLCIYSRTFRYWIPHGSQDLQFFHLLQNWRVKYRELWKFLLGLPIRKSSGEDFQIWFHYFYKGQYNHSGSLIR